jgi:hypothetical protein
MSTNSDPKIELLNKTADFYRRSLADYAQFVRTEKKPRTKKATGTAASDHPEGN